MGERPPRHIPSRSHLIHLLIEAAEIEHNLLCSYLYAAFSLKRQGEGLSKREADAVGAWRETIIGVAIEEMGHLALVNNLLVALGGNAHLGRPNLPVAPGYHPAGFVIRLTPFSKSTLDHFIYLERPLGSMLSDGKGFDDPVGVPRTQTPGGLTPSTPDYATIGEFYADIANEVTALVTALGEAALFGAAGQRRQLGPDLLDLPGLIRITSAADALAAIDTIVEQGEGAPAETETCHFVRFREIAHEWAAIEGDNPAFAPAQSAAEDPVMRRPAEGVDRVWITAPEAARLLDLGNATYGLTLSLLAQAYAYGVPRKDRAGYAAAAITLMHGLGAIGTDLARLPAGDDASNAGLTFAVPRACGPHDPKVAASLFKEQFGSLMAAKMTPALAVAFKTARSQIPRAPTSKEAQR